MFRTGNVAITVFVASSFWMSPVGGSAGEGHRTLRAYQSGNGFLNRGLYDLATDEYRTFLGDHPNHEKAATARYGLAVSLYRLDRLDEAVIEFAKLNALGEFEFAAEVGTILGQCYLVQERYSEAAAVFRRVVGDHRRHDLADDAEAGWAEALYLAGRFEDSRNRCRRFASHWPDSPLVDRVTYFRGLSEMALERYGAAADRFQVLLSHDADGPFASRATLLLAQCRHHAGDLEEAAVGYRRVIEEGEADGLPDALLGLATIALRRSESRAGDLDAAARASVSEAGVWLDRLIGEFPDSPLRATAVHSRGRVWFDLGRFDKAIKSFGQSAKVDVELADESAYWMAKCNLKQGEFESAARRLGKAIEEFPESPLLGEMRYDHAVALVRSGRVGEAVDALVRFLDDFPDHAMAAEGLYLLAATEHRLKKYEECGAHCAAFLERYPSHSRTSAVAFLEAENEFLRGRFEAAVEVFGRFLKHHADDGRAAKARQRLGTALYRLGRLEEASALLVGTVTELGTDGASVSNLLALGDIAFQRGEWKTAERYLEQYASSGDDPSSGDDALLKLGLARQRMGHPKEALEAYDRLLARYKNSPHRLQAVFERGQALLSLDRRQEAAGAFETVLTEGGDSRFAPYARNHLGNIAIRNKDFEGAAGYFDQASLAMTGVDIHADAAFQGGQALMGAQRFDEANAAFERFLDAHADHELAPRAEAQRAIALSRLDRYDDALKVIRRIEVQYDDWLDGPRRARGTDTTGNTAHERARLVSAVRYEKAWCLRHTGKTADAATTYRGLLEQFPDSPSGQHAMFELAGIEMGEKRFDSAAKLLRGLRGASKGASGDALIRDASYSLGVCEFELGRYREAAALLGEFLSLHPNAELIASASYFCGESLYQLRRHERAVSHFARIVDEFEANAAYPASLLRLAECQAVLQRWAKSERRFSQYLDRYPETERWFHARFGVGWARENQQRYGDAIESYRQVVERHQGPTAARAQFQIGECLFAQKQYSEAVRELLKVDILYAFPEWSAAALFEAGRCFEKLAKPVEAREQFREVVTKYGGTRWAKMAVQRLDAVVSGGVPGR